MPSKPPKRIDVKSFRRIAASVFWIVLITGPVGAQSIDMAPIGDGSALGISINNPNASSIDIDLHPVGVDGLKAQVERVQRRFMTVQCLEGADGALPRLQLTVGERTQDVESFSVAYDSGPPAIWVSSAQRTSGPRTGG